MAMVDNLKTLLANGADSALLRFGLGQEYTKLGNHDEAVEHLRVAVGKDPKYSAAWKLLGKALAESGHNDEAIFAYESGIRVAEENGDVQAAREMAVFLRRLQK